jgi:hypothetical protein
MNEWKNNRINMNEWMKKWNKWTHINERMNEKLIKGIMI